MAKIPINVKSGELEQPDLVIGIDLGTTNSLVAYVKDGLPTLIRSAQDKKALVPSIIHFAGDTLVVGDEAKHKLVTHPESTIYSVKRLLGKSMDDLSISSNNLSYRIIDEEDRMIKVQVDDKFYSPVALSAEILKFLKTRIENHLKQTVSKAVITVPAYFNDAQRQATRDAGRLAGLDILRIINEPTAAALAYGYQNKDTQEKVIVFDLGGGTFDVTILSINDGVFDVLSTNGDTHLGGDDFDRLISEYWLSERYTETAISTAISHDSQMKQALRLSAEEAKKTLSQSASYHDDEKGLRLERATFNSLLEPLLEVMISKTQLAIKDSGLALDELDKIILVGGSTRVPIIKQKLIDNFGLPIYDEIDPDEVVALGAAVQADILAGNNSDMLLLDVTPLSLGIETVGGLMDTLIPRNSKVPSSMARNYTTSVDGQTKLKVSVYQGERDLVEDNRKLGEFVLAGIPPMAAGMPKIKVQFMLDADGILRAKALEERSGQETEIEIRSQYGISEEEMGKMLLDSLKHAETDMLKKSLTEAQVEGRSIVLATTKFQDQNAVILSSEEKEALSMYQAGLSAAIETGTKDEINLAIQTLNDYSAPLAQRAMDYNIKQAMQGKSII